MRKIKDINADIKALKEKIEKYDMRIMYHVPYSVQTEMATLQLELFDLKTKDKRKSLKKKIEDIEFVEFKANKKAIQKQLQDQEEIVVAKIERDKKKNK